MTGFALADNNDQDQQLEPAKSLRYGYGGYGRYGGYYGGYRGYGRRSRAVPEAEQLNSLIWL